MHISWSELPASQLICTKLCFLVCFVLSTPPATPKTKNGKGQQRESEQAGLERVRANLQAVSLDGCRRQSPVLILQHYLNRLLRNYLNGLLCCVA